MKILVPVEIETQLVEIDISAKEVIESISGKVNPRSVTETLEILQTCLTVIRTIPNEMIGNISDNSRAIIKKHLQEQIERY